MRPRAVALALALAVALAVAVALALAVAVPAAVGAQQPVPAGALRLERGRFTVIAMPGDRVLATSMLASALANDTFPGLPRPAARVTIAIAPDAASFREWAGQGAPEWGVAVAFPEQQRLVIQGHNAGSSAGDPRSTLRHELAHLALYEAMGNLPSRWFDEGYASFAAGEWGRDEVIATNLALLVRGVPALDDLDSLFTGGESRAQQGYALAQSAVAELDAIDPQRGLSLFFKDWRATLSFDQACRQAFGLTQAGFEQRWKSNTRRRFGGLALFANVTVGALLMLLLIGPFWVLRRQRDRARLAAMQASDALLDRHDEDSALDSLLHGTSEVTIVQRRPPGEPSAPDANDDQIK